MAKTVAELITNFESVLAELKKMPSDLKVEDFCLDSGGYSEPQQIKSIELEVEEVNDDPIHLLSIVVSVK